MGEIMNSPPKGSEIMCSGKSEPFLIKLALGIPPKSYVMHIM